MAVRITVLRPKYIGLNTDTKPTNPPAGTQFRETDTHLDKIYDGTNWHTNYWLGIAYPFEEDSYGY